MKPGRAALSMLRDVVSRLPNRYLLYLGLACMAANAGAHVLAGHLLRLLMDAATQGAGEAFAGILTVTVALHATRSFLSWGSGYASGKYAEVGVAHLREEAVRHLTKASFAEMEKVRSGDVISRLTSDLLWVRTFLGSNLSVLIHSPLETLLVFTYLCSVNWKLTLVAMATAPVLVVIGRIFTSSMYRLGLELRERMGTLTAIVKDVLAGISVCRAFNLECCPSLAGAGGSFGAGFLYGDARANQYRRGPGGLQRVYAHTHSLLPAPDCGPIPAGAGRRRQGDGDS